MQIKIGRTLYSVGTIDFETDPFLHGRLPEPFAVEFYSDNPAHCFSMFGDDPVALVSALLDHLNSLETPYVIYAHNGGKFDFHLIHIALENPVKIINARIVEAHLGIHIIRDSFSIIPVPLKAFKKDDIDYALMERSVRHKHRDKIMLYLHSDCMYLYELVVAFLEQFGNKLTVGSTAMAQLRKVHPFTSISEEGDAVFRQFYFGGRVQCFKTGILTDGPYHGYDVNSQYPKAMRDYVHPINCEFDVIDTLPDDYSQPFFLRFIGRNYGALPSRDDDADNGLTFDREQGEFFACSHELAIAEKYGLVEIDDVIDCYVSMQTIQFREFVDFWYVKKVSCKQQGDKIGELFAKFMLNSAYGKFGQNPANFADWLIWRNYGMEHEIEAKGYEHVSEFPDFELWKRPASITAGAFFDVSIAASITSAARSILLEGIQNAVDPIYCDTDSLICREFRGEISDTELGAWKHEFTAPSVIIARKKLYMAYDPALPWNYSGISKHVPDRAMNPLAFDRSKPENPIKIVSKGGNLTADQMLDLAKGEIVEFANPAPTFSLLREPTFQIRKFSMPDLTEPEIPDSLETVEDA